MKSSPELRPNRYDALVALAVLALAVLLGMRVWTAPAQTGELTVTVSVDGQAVERVPLSSYAGAHTYTGNGYTLTVRAADGALAVTESDCLGQDCVHSGAITRAGQSIVCLPARISITLSGTGSGYDLVTG